MTKVDQFESVFRSADKPVLRYRRVELERVLVVCDLEGAGARAFAERLKTFLAAVDDGAEWSLAAGDAFHTVEELLELVAERRPDLICTYRNLHSEAWRWPYSLGAHLDVLTQNVTSPVLVVPHPRAGRELEHALRDTDVVMAMTSRLAGEDSLVNQAARFTQEGGTLWLTHVEDQSDFERFIAAISKIETIDTDTAREEILAQLLKEPRDYIHSCRDVLAAEGAPIRVEEIVTLGQRLAEYERIVRERKVDLLVLHTKDADQSAMHGLAYPLAVELRATPLLLL